ncbi:flavin reductase [Streptomyces sp. NPDC005962]|uniref:flavin reductase n=1 Tax=Streptomyces sp. NPDC005962 TaxID=3154466 RepID=UPI00340D50BB
MRWRCPIRCGCRHQWQPPTGILPRGTLVVLPGRGEHGGTYQRFGRRLAADGYVVHALDTAPEHTAPEVLTRAVAAAGEHPAAPLVVIGGDTGALQALHAAATTDAPLAPVGLILAGTAPTADSPAPPTPTDEERGWEAELAARTACPTHRKKLTDDRAFARGRLFGPVPAHLLPDARTDLPALPEPAPHPRNLRNPRNRPKGSSMTVSTDHPATALTGTDGTDGAEEADRGEILRRTLRRHAAGVTVVTVPGPAGFTATSFTSVSLDPPLVSFYLGTTASTAGAVQRADRFAVHVLGADNTALAGQFARSGIDRFSGVSWQDAGDGLPVLDGVPAWLTARVTRCEQVGDHFLVIGEVESGGGPAEGSALVHHDGAFATAVGLTLPSAT